MAEEIWKSIPGCDGAYEVSSLGHVRSLDRVEQHVDKRKGTVVSRRIKGITLRPGISSSGYPTVAIHGKSRLVHELVLSAFAGPCPTGMECLHADGNRFNAAFENLRWGTRSENAGDRARHGTKLQGSRYPTAKLSEADAKEIRRLHRIVPQSELAKRYGVSPAAIQAIHDGRTWKHA